MLTPQGDDYDSAHYKKLRDGQDIAQINKVGLWKNLEKKEESKNKTQSYDEESSKEYEARVIEIHSGDSMTVMINSNESRRLFLASIKSPNMSRKEGEDHEPWAWEAKEYLRKQCIGKNVRIEMEFKKEIELRGEEFKGETKLMEFASVFVGKKNIAVSMLQQGYAKTALSKFQEDNSKYFQDLIKASASAEEKKKGIFSIKDPNIYRYIDTSKNLKGARTVFETLKGKGDMQGTIEYVISGSKFKVRLDQDNVLISFGLIGIDIPSPDANQADITEIYERAKNNAKIKLQQHDAIINIKHMDKKGNFLGNLWFYDLEKKKKGRNYIRDLVRNGSAAIQSDRANKIDEYKDIAEAQEEAQHDEIGIWNPKLSKIYGLPGDEDFEEEDSYVGQTFEGRVLDIQDASLFYIMFQKDDDKLAVIEETLKDYSKSSYETLKHPVKIGTICAAKFHVDDCYYRATVERQIHAKKKGYWYEVTFLDYGNKAEVSVSNLKKIDPLIVKYPPLAYQCNLAYIKVPRVSHTFGKAAYDYFKEKIWGKSCMFHIVDDEDYFLSVVVNPGKVEKPNDTIQAFLITEGVASIADHDTLPEKYEEWKVYEQEAKDDLLNIWEIDGGAIDI